MPDTMSGGCLCGAVRYDVQSEPLMQLVCHCTHCQKQAGSAFSTIVGVPEAALTVSHGAAKTFIDHGESGQPIERQFCDTCGSPLFSKVAAAPGMVFIKTGTLDDSSWFTPSAHIWTKSKQPWVETGSVPAFATNPG